MFGFSKPAEARQAEPPVDSTKPTPPEEPKGLDKFAKLLENKPDDGSSDKTQSKEDVAFNPLALLEDEEAVATLLSKIDFSKSISPETQQKLQSNDPSAMLDLVNDVSKASYLQAMRHALALSNRQIDERFKQHDGKVSNQINTSIKSADLASQIPEIKNPIVALGVQPFIDKLQAQNPSMSTKDIVAQVKEYLGELNQTFNPQAPSTSSKKNAEVDWLAELGLED